MSDLEDELARLNYDFEEADIEVEPLMDYGNLRFDGNNYNIIEGRKLNLPLWIAEILEENGIVMINTTNSGSVDRLRSVMQKERKYPTLTDLDRLLYRQVRNEINNLRAQGTQTSLMQLSSLEGSLNGILRLRTRKILQIVRDDEGMNNPNMTAEEEWLFERLNSLYSSWKEKVGKDALEGSDY